MRKKIYTLFFASLSCFLLHAQKPADLLNKWSEESPIEKVHLHTDRNVYIAGDTIWFKAYLYSESLPDTISTSLYVELVNGSSRIITRKIFPVLFYSARGQIELSDSLEKGNYFIRAYSPTMLNHDLNFVYYQSLLIFSKTKTTAKTISSKEKFIRLDFFPEGGNLINDLKNTVAFKATDQNGLPVQVSGSVMNERNESVTEFQSFHDGMGKFDLIPNAEEKYFVALNNDEGKTKYYLPSATDKGIIFHISSDNRGRTFEILQKKDDPIFQASYIIGQMQHKIVINQQLASSIEKIRGLIKTENLYSGILQLTVFNKDDMPLAERLIFVNNKEYKPDATLKADTINFSQRGKNHFTLLLKDTLTGAFSVSVTDPDYDIFQQRQNNILSDLLLTTDLPGFINNAAYYFTNDGDSLKEALDLVMMTNGWRRFKWNELIAGTIPIRKYNDLQFITIKGNIKIYNSNKDFVNQPLMVFVTSKDSSSMLQLISTGAKGSFKLDSLIFYEFARALFFDVRGKKSKFIEVYPDPDSLTRYYSFPFLNQDQFVSLRKYDSLSLVYDGKFSDEYDAIMRAKGLTLPGITIKVRKKTPLEDLEERYVSGLFASGAAERTIDLTEEQIFGQNIFEYLRSRVPGIRVQANGFDYQVYYRGVNSISLGPTPMNIYLDEILTDPNIVAAVPINDIALVKVFDTFVGGWGNSPGGALAIYTKKGDDLFKNNISQQRNRIVYRGYSVIKEFYSPDYSFDTTTKKSFDSRITLYWNSNIIVSDINPTIPIIFYNNDRTRRFKVIIEGITTSGKMICIEKTFDAEQKQF